MNSVYLKSAIFDSLFSLKIAQTCLPLLALPHLAAEVVVAATAETAAECQAGGIVHGDGTAATCKILRCVSGLVNTGIFYQLKYLSLNYNSSIFIFE